MQIKIIKKFKYYLKIVFLALADISMCECYNDTYDNVIDYI